jgi:hypothetical protein
MVKLLTDYFYNINMLKYNHKIILYISVRRRPNDYFEKIIFGDLEGKVEDFEG